jgi:hypothetical protein
MAGLELSVLGPVTATRDGGPLDLGGPRQRAVLAAVLAASPGMVPADLVRSGPGYALLAAPDAIDATGSPGSSPAAGRARRG